MPPDASRRSLAQRDATIAELRAEVERLKDDLRQAKYMEACARALMASSTEEEDANFERIVSERDALRASHERLRKALENVVKAAGSYRSDMLGLVKLGDKVVNVKGNKYSEGLASEWSECDEHRDRHLREARAALSAAPKESVD